MFVIVLLVVFSICIATGGGNVKVTFTSSHDPPIIAEGDTAVFNCSSNHSLVLINWILNETVSASTLTSLGVIVNGAATPVSSLIIPGLVDPFNDTEVQCVAFGFGIGDFSPSSVTLKVQGIPAPVDNLTLSYYSCCYTFSWIAPFTLPGFPILNYNVSVTSNDEMINQAKLNDSVIQWIYYPKEVATHTFSIAAVNNVGEGKISNLPMEKNEINDTELIDQYLDYESQNHIIDIKISRKDAEFKNCIFNHVALDCTDSNAIFNSSNITNDAFVTFNISAADKVHKVTTHITLQSGLVVNSDSSNPLSLSKF
ncbi:PREDICTED: uncharacterized protein LOC109590376 [Amphimedon queenslandica]|uniref:Fibronectin type-III domain-containing protein n=2 Tax=Amphimedon queenslandica TaxID=400682 RepID=A0AAN0JXM6_AMPQE|nr:PREDICTED: uncharacterized protein LOC109590376 [Amphimedon queenslandica]|eukprot:XP_019861859.1 PREDICTED: uncharacterized protein LOC109590376 [Amphimedon queenslandica]